MSKPAVFIGSSSEGLEFARAVRFHLEKEAEVTLWDEDFFDLGRTFIESLVDALPSFDFAVLVLSSDDLVTSRETESFGPRDNVIFELGLFMGQLGRSRTFILYRANANLKLPSDLAGLSCATFEWPRKDQSYKAAVGSACDKIRASIHRQGISDTKVAREVRDIRGRQETAESRLKEAELKIERLFANTMSEPMFSNLVKLSTGKFGTFTSNGDLRRHLRHLRDLGYVKVQGQVSGLPKTGENLSKFVAVTEAGRDFVRFRQHLEGED